MAGLSILAGGAAAWLTGAESAMASVGATAPAQHPFGGDIIIKSQVDPNFCLNDLPAPANPASEADVSQCITQTGNIGRSPTRTEAQW
jgi:hypothetical protein